MDLVLSNVATRELRDKIVDLNLL